MNYQGKTIRGFTWLSLFRLLTRAISFLRTAILARILLPAQFGVFGIAAIVVSLLEILTETGINVFLIQERSNLKKYLNTAWAISIIRGVAVGLLIFIFAPLVGAFFRSEESVGLIRLAGLIPFIRGFINPSIVKLQRDLKFKKEFIYNTSYFTLDAFVAISVSYITKSPIGLVWGMISGVVLEVVFSHVLIKPSPKLEFDTRIVKKIIKRGKWVTMSGIFGFIAQEGDDTAVAKLMNTSSLGLYQVAYKISTLPLTEITRVVTRITFPVYSKIIHDKKRVIRAFLKTSIVTTLLVIPPGVILFYFSDPIILLFLGKGWIEASEVLKVLAVFGVLVALTDVPHSLLLAYKKQKWVAVLSMVRALGIVVLIVPFVLKWGIVGAAYASILSVLMVVPFASFYLYKIIK